MNQRARHIGVTPWALFIFYLLGCSHSAHQEGIDAIPAPMTYFVAIDISGSMQEGDLHQWRHVLLKRLVEEAMNSRDTLVIYSYGPYCKTEYKGYARWEDVAPLAEKYFTGKISRERGTNPALPLEMICNSIPENTRF
ncbi:MAG: VWA domain-containing protein, partial [Candidatus Caldarchaeum sp.]